MKILEDASKFKRVNIEEGKAFQSFDLYKLCVLKSLKYPSEISEKEEKNISIRFDTRSSV